MKVLLIHNYYGSSAPSGENRVFEAEKLMLERHGVTVEVYARDSDEIRGRGLYGLIKGALCTVGNFCAARDVMKRIREFKPDIVHFHNQFPLISPLAVRAARKSGTRVVMTLHNYRTVCAAGVPTRDGHVCTECFLQKANGPSTSTLAPSTCSFSVEPALRHRCYRGSLLATIPLAVNILLYRKCWAKWVDRFIVLSEFQKAKMIECGFPADKIVVKGNFVSRVEVERFRELKDQAAYVGRLSEEKGVRTLIEAWRLLGSKYIELLIVGDGEKRAEYEKLAEGTNIRFLGQKSYDEVLRLMVEARCIVQPSACWETFGLTVVEAMGVGTPAVVSNVGALPDLVEGGCGELFEAGDAEALAKAVEKLFARQDYESLSSVCEARVTARYTEEANYRQLKEVYANLAGDK